MLNLVTKINKKDSRQLLMNWNEMIIKPGIYLPVPSGREPNLKDNNRILVVNDKVALSLYSNDSRMYTINENSYPNHTYLPVPATVTITVDEK